MHLDFPERAWSGRGIGFGEVAHVAASLDLYAQSVGDVIDALLRRICDHPLLLLPRTRQAGVSARLDGAGRPSSHGWKKPICIRENGDLRYEAGGVPDGQEGAALCAGGALNLSRRYRRGLSRGSQVDRRRRICGDHGGPQLAGAPRRCKLSNVPLGGTRGRKGVGWIRGISSNALWRDQISHHKWRRLFKPENTFTILNLFWRLTNEGSFWRFPIGRFCFLRGAMLFCLNPICFPIMIEAEILERTL